MLTGSQRRSALITETLVIGHERGLFQIFLASAGCLTDPLLVATVVSAVGFPGISIMHRKLEATGVVAVLRMSKQITKYAISGTGNERDP